MDQWLKERLSCCLGFEVPEEMISYIMKLLDDTQKLDEYCKSLLDSNNPEHVEFLKQLKQRARKTGDNRNKSGKGAGKSQTAQRPDDKQKQKVQEPVPTPVAAPPPAVQSQRKKTKYVNLYGQDGEVANVIKLKGRHRCDCQASKHKLVNNCLNCGRIVCEQEGSGPCLFCGNLVCTQEEQRVIDSSSKKGDNLKRSLMEQNRPKGWEEAMATRNRLLEYDRNSEARTTIIDDESDYFSSNSVWLSDAERKKLEKLESELFEKKHASRLTRKVTLDFGARQVIDEPQLTYETEDAVLQSIAQMVVAETAGGAAAAQGPGLNDLSGDTHPGIVDVPQVFHSETTVGSMRPRFMPEYDGIYSRVQDKALVEMSDMGHCLSMHQPWASLLVNGIKRHEGRTWYTPHRGRLWIAATVKPVEMELVKQMENFYRVLYNDEEIVFPTQYPSGCLLGCVSLQDCLPQEEYRKHHPDGESDSPFVFVCTDPQELPIRFPIKGQHKIYVMDSKIHQAAVKSLQRMARLKAEE